MFTVPDDWIPLLNEAAVFAADGDVKQSERVLAKWRKQLVSTSVRTLLLPATAYTATPPEQLYGSIHFCEQSLTWQEAHEFVGLGWPNVVPGRTFRLQLIQVARDALSIAGMDLLLSSFGLRHAGLREGLIYLSESIDVFGCHSVSFLGSARAVRSNMLEVPVMSFDGGLRLLSKRRIDPDDHLSQEVYAVVWRS